VSTLCASVSAGEAGPVITLSGETDMTTVAELSELVTAQLSGGTLYLTIDASGLSFADLASVRVIMLAARTLQERGGGLVLLRPQRVLADAGSHGRGPADHDPRRNRGQTRARTVSPCVGTLHGEPKAA
jgi:anti-anti-sigma factor